MERRALEGGIHVLVPTALEGRGFLAAFTERGGGTSEGPYRSLNLGARTGDRPGRVAENRSRVTAGLGVEGFAAAEQVHGARVVPVGRGRTGAGFEDNETAIPGADALAVTRPRLPVAVLVADCVPLVLASPEHGMLVAVHAGWRGVATGIVDAALRRFPDLAGARAAIGPAIGPCHYEVGEDVALAVASAAGGVRTERRGERLYLDLPGTVARILRAAGVRAIERAGECTACEEARFFSYRRDGETGRQAVIAMRLSTGDRKRKKK
jgi:YfiH family protein